MKYLILIYHETGAQRPRPNCDDLRRDRIRAHLALTDDLAADGEMIAAESLAHPSQARRVLACEGGVATIDGAFAGAHEHLAGFYLVECETMDRAVERAARIPEAADGLVEVRPVLARGGLEM
ncbi:YciI family protein [Jiangella asiatica]|uniref:YciI family protein n=1 Tax=Jiangella asiatica TaxID=2530372 RepID=A0A4R5DD92_9ACTN|nr:YciI family protein [Jiangella asiatica]TDE11782.1 YciI family protein [Jiangella asiatica]